MPSSGCMMPIKFTETIQDVLKTSLINVALKTQPRLFKEMSICLCKVKGQLSEISQIKVCDVDAAFLSVSYYSNNTVLSIKKTSMNG